MSEPRPRPWSLFLGAAGVSAVVHAALWLGLETLPNGPETLPEVEPPPVLWAQIAAPPPEPRPASAAPTEPPSEPPPAMVRRASPRTVSARTAPTAGVEPRAASAPSAAPAGTSATTLPSASAPTVDGTLPLPGPPGPSSATRAATQGPGESLFGYVETIRRRLGAERRYPRRAVLQRQEGTTLLQLVIDAGGRLAGPPVVLASAGHEVLDREAVRMAEAAAPYPPPPGHPPQTFRVPIEFALRAQ